LSSFGKLRQALPLQAQRHLPPLLEVEAAGRVGAWAVGKVGAWAAEGVRGVVVERASGAKAAAKGKREKDKKICR
jgi:hypothetical protein